MSQGAASFTIQLNSATSEKRTGEHYVRQLDPPITIPYLARPRAMLEGLSFSNSFSNVDSTFDNNKVRLAWYGHTVGTGAESAWRNMELTVDTGYYDIASLEAALARKLKAASTGTPTYSYDKQTETLGSNLWDTMDTYCSANAQYNLDDVAGRDRADSIIEFNARVAIVSGATESTENTPQPDVFSHLPDGRLLIPVEKSTLELWRGEKFTQPPEWLIGSTLHFAKFTGYTTSAMASNGGFQTGRKIIAIHKMPANTSLKYLNSSNTEETLHLSEEYAIELDNSAPDAQTKTSVLVSKLTVDGGHPDLAIGSSVTFEFTPTGADDAQFRGYGAKGLADPSLDADSGWGSTILPGELETVVKTETTKANSVVVGSGALATVPQYERYVRPFNFGVDGGTNKLSYFAGWPGVYICKGSTLFTGMLGFSDDQLADDEPTPAQMAVQNPFAASGGLHVAAPSVRTLFQSVSEIQVTRVRALQFNCPSLVPATYGPDGKLSAAQMCSVPVLVGQNQIQTFQASYDNSTPCDLHGANINEIEFYLTDQAGKLINLQKSTFQATIRVFYPDPIHPHVGEADAEKDPLIGLRDYAFRTS